MDKDLKILIKLASILIFMIIIDHVIFWIFGFSFLYSIRNNNMTNFNIR